MNSELLVMKPVIIWKIPHKTPVPTMTFPGWILSQSQPQGICMST